ncbi:MAG: hypothetical protein QNM02_09435, partial [Acidimicrobiia bacterium]|nr:hypothetical protein [Acidimicrobiia bacterium]
TFVDSKTGMWRLDAQLDPVRGAIVDRHLQAELARLRAQDQQTGTEPVLFMQLKVDALVSAMSTSGDGVPARPELVVHVDWDWLRGQTSEAGCVRRSTESSCRSRRCGGWRVMRGFCRR